MKKQYAILICFVIISSFSYAQNDTTDTTQLYKVEKLLLNNTIPHFISNPASTGLFGQNNVDLTGGMNWSEIIHCPVHFLLSYNGRITKKRKIGFGEYVQYERKGMVDSWQIGMSGSYHLTIKEKLNVSIGTSLSLQHWEMDPDSLFSDQFHPLYGSIFPTIEEYDNTLYDSSDLYLNARTGLLFNYKNLFTGISILHYFKNIDHDNYYDKTTINIPDEINFFIIRSFIVSEKIKMSPALHIISYFNMDMEYIDSRFIPSVAFICRNKLLLEISSNQFNTLNLKAGMHANDHFCFFLQTGMPIKNELFYINKIYLLKGGVGYYF